MNNDIFALYEKVLDDPKLDTVEKKKEMFNEIRKLMSPEQNRWNFRYAILPLAFIGLSVPIYAILQIFFGKEIAIPEALLSLASTAVGALAGFIAQYAQGRDSTIQQIPATTVSGPHRPNPALQADTP